MGGVFLLYLFNLFRDNSIRININDFYFIKFHYFESHLSDDNQPPIIYLVLEFLKLVMLMQGNLVDKICA